jgi:hypothetical protein
VAVGPVFQGDHLLLIQHGGLRWESSKRMRGLYRRLFEIGAGGLLFVACAPAAIFPPEIMEKADRSITFKEVIAHPAEYEGRVVEFGGEILGSIVKGEEVQLLVRELPVRTSPVYGLVDPVGSGACLSFALAEKSVRKISSLAT